MTAEEAGERRLEVCPRSTVPAGLPFLTRNQTTRREEDEEQASRTMVPMMPVHLPHFISTIESMTIAHTTTSPTTIDQKC